MIRFYKEKIKQKEYLNRNVYVADCVFWNNVREYFNENPNEECLLVSNEGCPLAFCYSDNSRQVEMYMSWLDSIENLSEEISNGFCKAYPKQHHICIVGLNELAWRTYHALKKEGISVSVIGEEWEWFGIHTIEWKEKPLNCGTIFADGRNFESLHGSDISEEFRYLENWGLEIKKQVYHEVLKRLEEKGASVCRVKIPEKERLDLHNLTKNDLLNVLLPLPSSPLELAGTKQERERQLDFFGEATYRKLEKGINFNQDAWEKVYSKQVRIEKLRGVSHKNRIYLLGPCIVGNYFSLAENSVTAMLQKKVEKFDYEVVRVVVPAYKVDVLKTEIEELPLRKKDILICLEVENHFYEDEPCIDLFDIYNVQRSNTWIYDECTAHVNADGNKAIAEEIFRKYINVKCSRLSSIKDNYWIQKGEIADKVTREKFRSYTDQIRVINIEENKKIGSIVMNCNPFTKGHQFLIESATKIVDFLYVFIVEEDKSDFPFDIRIELVRRGTEHLQNVVVIPSGKYILSYDTLPIYFEKAEKQESVLNATKDLEIFAHYIAPALGITCRFAGEEPTDMITKQYNIQMGKILREYGIEFIEIPRKTSISGKVISASLIRRLLEEGKFEETKGFLSDKIFACLRVLLETRWVIYGAGKMGHKLYEKMKKYNCNIVGWVDLNYQTFDQKLGIESPHNITEKTFDYVLVAVKSEDLFEEIKEFLCCELGVDISQIKGPMDNIPKLMAEIMGN